MPRLLPLLCEELCCQGNLKIFQMEQWLKTQDQEKWPWPCPWLDYLSWCWSLKQTRSWARFLQLSGWRGEIVRNPPKTPSYMDIYEKCARYLREALLKKNVFFRVLPEKGGGRPLPEFFYPFSHHVVPYILTSISCYLILFGRLAQSVGLSCG